MNMFFMNKENDKLEKCYFYKFKILEFLYIFFFMICFYIVIYYVSRYFKLDELGNILYGRYNV